jgi:hypothetical protein
MQTVETCEHKIMDIKYVNPFQAAFVFKLLHSINL